MKPDLLKENPNTRLVEAVRQVKIEAAERSDVVVDMKEADRARLEILAQELQPVFDAVPADDERFDFAISSGLQPRLWIDATAHVMMGRDRRTYRFVRDTRIGRTLLAETSNIQPVLEAVTKYIAERLHEREMAFAGDEMASYRPGIGQRVRSNGATMAGENVALTGTMATAFAGANAAGTAAVPKRAGNRAPYLVNAGWFLLGFVVACGAAALYFRDQLVP